MSLERIGDDAAFRSAIAPLISADPARCTIVATVSAQRAIHGPFPGDVRYVVRDGFAGIVGAALRTPPWPLTAITGTGFDAQAARVLAAGDPECGGLTGPLTTVVRFGPLLGAALGRPGRQGMAMWLYRLGELHSPAATSGEAVQTGPDRVDSTRRLIAGFAAALGQPLPEQDVEQQLAAGRRFLLWLDSGEPVALAGHSPVIAGSARISYVYTVPAARGRGFGAAVTAAAVESARAAGAAEIVLFADQANPTSNGIYERLGFDRVDEFGEWRFS